MTDTWLFKEKFTLNVSWYVVKLNMQHKQLRNKKIKTFLIKFQLKEFTLFFACSIFNLKDLCATISFGYFIYTLQNTNEHKGLTYKIYLLFSVAHYSKIGVKIDYYFKRWFVTGR